MLKLFSTCFLLGGLSLVVGCAATTPRSLNSPQDSAAPAAVTTPAVKARAAAKDAQQKALDRSTMDPSLQPSPSPSTQP
ncbi:MAG TPA: hypothetical protein V6C64_11660 [Microcoleaceae cyanobacterium]